MRKKVWELVIRAGPLLLLPLLSVMNVQAASFDCAKATTKVEKLICSNAKLSQLDEELDRVYKEALKISPEPEKLKERQKRWLKYWQTECSTVEGCLVQQWGEQIVRLSYIIAPPIHKFQDTIFKYELNESSNDQVCQHMLEVFNSKFSTLWVTEQTEYMTGEKSPEDGLPILKPNPSYAEHGKYAFPKLPGVEHDVRETFEMRLTKLPTSPEFNLIHWQEGRSVLGKGLSSEQKVSILVADFDIDNDGNTETVLKISFFGGENIYSVHGGEDTYLIYLQGGVDPTKVVDFRILNHNARNSISGKFMRPFILNGKTYLTAYEQSFGILEPESQHIELPKSEEMIVQLYQKEIDSASVTMNTICRYQMIAVGSIDTTIEKEK